MGKFTELPRMFNKSKKTDIYTEDHSNEADVESKSKTQV